MYPPLGPDDEQDPQQVALMDEEQPEMEAQPVEDGEADPLLSFDMIEAAFLQLTMEFDRHDEYTRDYQVRMWARNDLFVRGIQNVYFSELAHDFRTLNSVPEFNDYDPDLETKIVNILKPYRESIVAALSVGIPVTRFYPDDAENSEDILTAQTWSKAADLIRRKNRARFLFIKALSTQWTHGFVAAYNYAETDEKYGTTKV